LRVDWGEVEEGEDLKCDGWKMWKGINPGANLGLGRLGSCLGR